MQLQINKETQYKINGPESEIMGHEAKRTLMTIKEEHLRDTYLVGNYLEIPS